MLILVRACNRPELLALTLHSIGRSFLPAGSALLVLHDGPSGSDVQRVLSHASGEYFGDVDFKWDDFPQCVGIDRHVLRCVERMTKERASGNGLAMLGDDFIAARPWALILEHLARELERGGQAWGYVSGYNAHWSQPAAGNEWRVPGTFLRTHAPPVGLFHWSTLRLALADYNPDTARDAKGDRQSWDSHLMQWCGQHERAIVSTARSVIQHVGLIGCNGPFNPPAEDWLGWC